MAHRGLGAGAARMGSPKERVPYTGARTAAAGTMQAGRRRGSAKGIEAAYVFSNSELERIFF